MHQTIIFLRVALRSRSRGASARPPPKSGQFLGTFLAVTTNHIMAGLNPYGSYSVMAARGGEATTCSR